MFAAFGVNEKSVSAIAVEVKPIANAMLVNSFFIFAYAFLLKNKYGFVLKCDAGFAVHVDC